MIKATVYSTIDQGLLSALSFVLAIALVRWGGKEELGLYTQLLNLQSFFSPIHAGLFVSAFLAVAARLSAPQRTAYRASMARWEFLLSPLMAALSVVLLAIGWHLAGSQPAPWLMVAFGMALLGLWWREFIRQAQFADMRHQRALLVDGAYSLLLLGLIGCAIMLHQLDTAVVFWSMAIASLVAALPLLVGAARRAGVGSATQVQALRESWGYGKWDALGSVVTWACSQSYVYVAALHGGLAEAGEVSAARLLAAPLALSWASYANVLRPRASQLLAAGSQPGLRRIARSSALLVLAGSLAYALALDLLAPWINRAAFGGTMQHLAALSLWWTAYVAVSGFTTIASGIMRSALAFRQLLALQVATGAVALAMLAASLRFPFVESLVVAMLGAECVSASLSWIRMDRLVLQRAGSMEV